MFAKRKLKLDFLSLSIVFRTMIVKFPLMKLLFQFVQSLAFFYYLKTTFKNILHFDILSRNVYIALFRKYNMAGEKRILYACR